MKSRANKPCVFTPRNNAPHVQSRSGITRVQYCTTNALPLAYLWTAFIIGSFPLFAGGESLVSCISGSPSELIQQHPSRRSLCLRPLEAAAFPLFLYACSPTASWGHGLSLLSSAKSTRIFSASPQKQHQTIKKSGKVEKELIHPYAVHFPTICREQLTRYDKAIRRARWEHFTK